MILIFYIEQRSEKRRTIFRPPQTKPPKSSLKHFSKTQDIFFFYPNQQRGDIKQHIRNLLEKLDTVFTGRSSISFNLMDVFITYYLLLYTLPPS